MRKDVLDENDNEVDKTFYINGIQYKGETEATATLDFIQTEEGRAVPAENSTYTYEYFLKDHLGNVRASLKTEPEVVDFTATMEQADAEKEEEFFKNLESRQLDATNAKNGTYSAYLNNASEYSKHRGIGPAIMLRVSPGDTVNASVYGKYADKTDNTEHVVDNIFTLLATAFGLNAATSEAGLAANGMENALAGQAAITPDGNAPKAYLNYIFLDKNFDPNNNHTGFERLPSGALNNYQLLEKEISIDREGFLYIFVANESPYDQGVWFDDFTVEVIKSPVSALSDYYPFGMLQAGNSTNSGDPVGNKYLYNGKELQEDLGLQWYDYGARMYDASVGRFFSQDRFAEKYLDFSPYQYTLNNPIKYIDINGDSTVIVLYGDSNTWYESPTGERFLLYDLHVYTDMTQEQYNEHVENGTLPDANYTAQFARDAHDVTKDGSRVNHSSERYGSNNETPSGTYFLFKRGTNGDYKDGSYDLYIGDDNGSRVINGPDGKRTGIAIHQWDPRDSQGCITSCTGADTSPVTNLMNAIPDLDDDTQPVRMIIQPRNVEVLQWANSSNGTNKYKGVGAQYRSRYRQGPIINGQGGVKPIKPGPLK